MSSMPQRSAANTTLQPPAIACYCIQAYTCIDSYDTTPAADKAQGAEEVHLCGHCSLDSSVAAGGRHLDAVLGVRGLNVEQSLDAEDVHCVITLPQQHVHPRLETLQAHRLRQPQRHRRHVRVMANVLRMQRWMQMTRIMTTAQLKG